MILVCFLILGVDKGEPGVTNSASRFPPPATVRREVGKDHQVHHQGEGEKK